MTNFATWGARYWPAFLIISTIWLFLAFGGPEAYAIFGERGQHVDNTLSYYARRELHAGIATAGNVHTVAWWCTFIPWMIFVIWITAHIWFADLG